MYKFFIVDDEPPFIRAITRLIEDNFDQIQIVGFAYNGETALKKIKENPPDVVITDIKMPKMDGITLLNRINEEMSDTRCVVISGYQDFNYAKQAMKSGVTDYILKPIDRKQFTAVITDLLKEIAGLQQEHEERSILQLYNGKPVKTEDLQRYFRYKKYRACIIQNGLYSSNYSNAAIQPIKLSSFNAHCQRMWQLSFPKKNQIMMVFGYDTHINSGDINQFKQLLDKDITLCLSNEFEEISELKKIVSMLDEIIRYQLIIGKSQLIKAEDVADEIYKPLIDNNKSKKIEVLTKAENFSSMNFLLMEIYKWFVEWEAEQKTQFELEQAIKQIFHMVQRFASQAITVDIIKEFEKQMLTAGTFTDLYIVVHGILVDVFEQYILKDYAAGVGTIEKEIDTYIEQNMNKPISLSSTSEHLNISQPYLSKLMRRFKSLSFNEYVTKKKIDAAEGYMQDYPDMLIKDIAELVGYEDHHYFSRVFKSITGETPSVYRKQHVK